MSACYCHDCEENRHEILWGLGQVFADVMQERKRQEHFHHGDTCWELGKPWRDKMVVLMNEAEEVAEAVLFKNRANLRDELIQVAAVAVAWVQALDRAEEAQG